MIFYIYLSLLDPILDGYMNNTQIWFCNHDINIEWTWQKKKSVMATENILLYEKRRKLKL